MAADQLPADRNEPVVISHALDGGNQRYNAAQTAKHEQKDIAPRQTKTAPTVKASFLLVLARWAEHREPVTAKQRRGPQRSETPVAGRAEPVP